jgi:starch phosphorylase
VTAKSKKKTTPMEHKGVSEEQTHLHKLDQLARNLWWTWQPEAVAVFRDLNPQLWREVNHNPIVFLQRIEPAEVERKAHDMALGVRISTVVRQLQSYLESDDAWALAQASFLRVWPVAYFSAEFGLHESIPSYAGGLGLLAGDHLKSASDLGVPIVGVGLLYTEGYFHQVINPEGWQEEKYDPINMTTLPFEPVTANGGNERLMVDIPLEDRAVKLQVWKAMVGRVPLYLLDSNVEDNSDEDRHLTGRLYDADPFMRIRQELILGVGGMRVLAGVGKMPGVVHLNEGHSAFALFEWMRLHMSWEGVSFEKARDHVGRRAIFTTHTPVAAGHDRFDPKVVLQHLDWARNELGLDKKEFLGLGRVNPDDDKETFCMTVLALKIAHRANGVSALHGRVSRNMWRPLYGMRSEQEVPIGHITNGVHVAGWLAPQMRHLFEQLVGPRWIEDFHRRSVRENIARIPDEVLWETHLELKKNLLHFTRRRLRFQAERWQAKPDRLAEIDQMLDPDALTIGFARRFAEYKRATLIFSDVERLLKLVNDAARPVQFIFAGKSHPANDAGKQSIQQIIHHSLDKRFKGNVAFIEDYDISVGRHLVQGVDLWLNNPIKPLEASGTSGQKVIMNGGLNLSVLDGWWPEAYDGHNGFAIGYGGYHPDPEEQSRRDAGALFHALENEVIPLFFNRDASGIPHKWIKMVKWAIVSLGWRFSAQRMVADYFRESYLEAAGVMPSDMREYKPMQDGL